VLILGGLIFVPSLTLALMLLVNMVTQAPGSGTTPNHMLHVIALVFTTAAAVGADWGFAQLQLAPHILKLLSTRSCHVPHIRRWIWGAAIVMALVRGFHLLQVVLDVSWIAITAEVVMSVALHSYRH